MIIPLTEHETVTLKPADFDDVDVPVSAPLPVLESSDEGRFRIWEFLKLPIATYKFQE